MTTLAVIPARWASSRFPGKPLAEIAGRPMIELVWRRVSQVEGVDRVVVATDDRRIAEACTRIGIEWVMTSSEHATGTDRVAEVARLVPAEVYVNVQGDEPLIDPASVAAVVRCLKDGQARGIDVATAYIRGASPEQKEHRSVVHLVPTVDGCVLTLSRLPVPCEFVETFDHTVHVGLYAFTGAALERFTRRSRGPVERAESIELLRFLEYGDRIAAVAVPPGSIGVDHPEDIARVEALMKR